MDKLFPSLTAPEDNKSSGNKLDQLQQGSLFHSIEYELSGIVNKIRDIDNLNQYEIKDIIMRQYSMILNYDLFLMSDETRAEAQILFTNKKFLSCLLDVIRLLNITNHEKICLNKLAYDYYILPGPKDEEVSRMLYQLTTEVNGREVVALSGIIGMGNAQILSMIRNSSFKEEKVIHRVNTYIMKCNIDLSIQNIISIYCFLFERFTNVFIYTMLEAKPKDITAEQNRRFDNMSIAILEILNSLTSSDIEKVLRDYAFILSMVKSGTEVRFSLRTAIRYDRILKVIRRLEIADNISII